MPLKWIKGTPPNPRRCRHANPPREAYLTPQDASKMPPRRPKMAQEASKMTRDASKRPQEAYKRLSRSPKIDFWKGNDAKLAPKSDPKSTLMEFRL